MILANSIFYPRKSDSWATPRIKEDDVGLVSKCDSCGIPRNFDVGTVARGEQGKAVC